MADDKSVVRDLIERLRQEIDDIDEKIIELVRLRTEVAARIARLKRGNNLPMVNGARERDVFGRYVRVLAQLSKTMATALLLRNRHPESDLGQKPKGEES